MPAGLTHTRLVVIFGFAIIIATNMMLSPDVDVMDGAAIPKNAPAPGGSYQQQIVVDPKTGAVSSVAMISEQARSQQGGLLKQDSEELRR